MIVVDMVAVIVLIILDIDFSGYDHDYRFADHKI
jgi:hypothetical protein